MTGMVMYRCRYCGKVFADGEADHPKGQRATAYHYCTPDIVGVGDIIGVKKKTVV